MTPKYLVFKYKTVIVILLTVLASTFLFVACKKENSITNPLTPESSAQTVSSQMVSTTEETTSSARGTNQAPNARAGNDQTITLPTNSMNFDGSGSYDDDGSITSYQWTKETGPAATIASPTSAQTAVTGLAGGSYRFRLTVTDNKGATGTDTVHLTVNGAGGGTPPNQAPTVNAGTDITITLPVNSVSFTGTASDADGTVASYLWAKVSGTGGTIASTTSATTNITGLTAGSYVFSLTATDNQGATATDNVTVTVNAAAVNQAPTVNAGTDKSITLPTNSVSLTGTASDADGTVASYLWAKVSGTGGTIASTTSATTNITGLTAGSYVFSLTATDNQGATATDNVTVTVNAAPVNQAPTVNAGTDKSITLPTNSVSLTGTASDADGTVASYLWTKVSGTGGTIASTTSATTNITGLTAGSYVFSLKATDNQGATATDNVTVTVNAAANQAPTVNAGIDKTITLPTNSVSLTGTASDADGTVVSYLWTKVSGSGGTITTPSSNSTTVTGLSAGNYTFRLTVADNMGATATDDIVITVNSAGDNTGYTLVYSTGYDDVNSIDPFGNEQWGGGTQASHLSTSILKSGAGAFKSVPADLSSGIRSEVQYGSGQSPLEGIVEYDVYYDNFFSNSGHSLQWHPTTSGGSGTGLYHKNGQLQFVTVTSGTSGTNVGSPFTVSTKTWHHIKLTYKFGSSGYIKVEFDGVEKVNSNVQMGDGSTPYLKVGVNMWVEQTSLVYYDNLKIYRK